MKVLFYLQPRVELGDPFFRYATLRGPVVAQLESLRRSGVQTHLVLGQAVRERAAEHGLVPRLGSHSVLTDSALSGVVSSYQADARAWYRQTATPSQHDAMRRLVESSLPSGFVPDVILVWETPTPYLQELFPQALLLYQWPGFVSRPPFPELVTFDTGLLGRSATSRVLDAMLPHIGLTEAQQRLKPLREGAGLALQRLDPLERLVQRYRHQFERLVLVPLQVDDYFTVTEVLPEGQSQLDFLVALLSQIPEHVGVVVTQYVSSSLTGEVLTPAVAARLRESFPHFLYDPLTDRVPYCSQFLVRALDGTIAISSSVGLQAALWSKPLLAVGHSHIAPFATARDVPELLPQLGGPELERGRQLAVLLPRQHPPLRTLVTRDGLLAAHLAQLCAANQSGDLAAGRWPLVLTEPEYFDATASLLRAPDLKAALQRANVVVPRATDPYDAISAADVVCFDLFDTLLQRPLEHPTDVFSFMEAEARTLLDLPALDFVSARREAERRAFALNLARGVQESTLLEIYQTLAAELGVPERQVSELMHLELKLERDFLRPRPIGKALFDFARSRGKRVVVISDMYLPEEFLAERLAEHGFAGYERLFVSSSHRAKKQTGALFQLAIDALGAPPERILHIGDNPVGDLEQPRRAGLQALLLRRAMPYFRETSAYGLLWSRDEQKHHRDWRAVLTVVAQGLYDEPLDSHRSRTLFSGQARALGYYGLGPLLLGFTKWLVDEAVRDRKERLFFLARDGLVMLRAYETVTRARPDAPRGSYLLCSRRAVNVAKLYDVADIMSLVDIDYAKMEFGRLLEHRFGLTRSASLEASIARSGLSWESPVDVDSRAEVKAAVALVADAILESAAAERAAYLAYLEQEGVAGSDRAVVDIGYAGTMQESLCQLLGQRGELDGYYLMTFRAALARQKSLGRQLRGYLGEFIDRHDTWHPFCKHVPLYETLLSSQTTSLVNFTRGKDGSPRPSFLPRLSEEAQRVAFVAEVQDGALSFVTDAVRAFGPHLHAMDIEPFKSLRPLQLLFDDAHPVDARMFQGVRFEDAYGGAQSRWILAPAQRLRHDASIWTRGREVLLKDARRRNGSRDSADWVRRAVHGVADRILDPRKSAKLRRDPARFFADARAPIRWLGKLYPSDKG